MLSTVTAFASSKKVKVAQPGTLAQSISAKQMKAISRLSIEGTVSPEDFGVIRQMASSNPKDGKAGRLKSLDLSKARILTGNDIFHMPDSLFSGCDILTDIEFPEDLLAIGYNSFAGCTSLRDITLHNVTYIACEQFHDMPSLETVTVTGRVVHMDSTPFLNLPKLRSATFGTLISTGDPLIAKNCPLLPEAVFRGILLNTDLQKTEDCPLFTKCRVEGYMNGLGAEMYEGRSLEEGGTAVADSVVHLFQYVEALPKETSIFKDFCSGIAYDAACLYSLKNNPDYALQLLDLSYGLNPMHMEYSHIMQDSDLDNVRNTARFASYAERVHNMTDYPYVLSQAPAYETGKDVPAGHFTYAPATDSSLTRIREYFRLDSIAGNGDETSRLKNVMYWVHDNIRHDGSSGIPRVKRTAIDLYEACRQGNRGMNCRGLAIVLQELYLALGYPARFVTCQPRAYDTDSDCHVICAVWSKQLDKWLWMDPTFAAYVSDADGNLLGIAEVRDAIRNGRPLVLNADANWNHRWNQTKENYLDNYMAKNLYYLSCYMDLTANTENGNGTVVSLQPGGHAARISGIITHDSDWFWQAPEKQ